MREDFRLRIGSQVSNLNLHPDTIPIPLRQYLKLLSVNMLVYVIFKKDSKNYFIDGDEEKKQIDTSIKLYKKGEFDFVLVQLPAGEKLVHVLTIFSEFYNNMNKGK